jgi:hypothetical protein
MMDMMKIFQVLGMFLAPFLVVLIPVYIGRRYGTYHIKKSADLKDAPVGTVVAAAFGTLAFFLAFVFQISANRYNDRKALLLEEVTNIRTAYLQAGLLGEPMRSDIRKLLVEYVDLRVDINKDAAKLTKAISRSPQILDTLWGYAEKLAEQDRSSEVYSLYTISINDLVNTYNHRMTMTFEYRIPSVILWILFIVGFFSMLTLGYQFGISGKGSSRINIVLALIFAVVMFLIISLDRPEIGLAKLNQKPLLTLQKQLQAMPGNFEK